jgi:hypothetical protein
MSHDRIKQLNAVLDSLCDAGNTLEDLNYHGLVPHVDSLITDIEIEVRLLTERTKAVVEKR